MVSFVQGSVPCRPVAIVMVIIMNCHNCNVARTCKAKSKQIEAFSYYTVLALSCLPSGPALGHLCATQRPWNNPPGAGLVTPGRCAMSHMWAPKVPPTMQDIDSLDIGNSGN